jgi:hypothetical protein
VIEILKEIVNILDSHAETDQILRQGYWRGTCDMAY